MSTLKTHGPDLEPIRSGTTTATAENGFRIGSPSEATRLKLGGVPVTLRAGLQRAHTAVETSPSAQKEAMTGVSQSGELSRSSTVLVESDVLRATPPTELGRAPLRRLVPIRTLSVARGHRQRLAPPATHEMDERGASVPPSQVQVPPSRVFPSMPTPPERPSAHSDLGRELLSAALSGEPGSKGLELSGGDFGSAGRKQLRLIVAGLMGSGKSTLCRMLAHLFNGVWVNQDEFNNRGKGAKRAFLAEIKRAASDNSVAALIVDKINTLRQHRREIMEAMESGTPGDLVLIQIRHPLDQPGRYDHMIQLCLSRIHARGEGHRTLMGNNPKLKGILRATADGAEPMQDDELRNFCASLVVDMTLSSTTAVSRVLSDLDDAELLGRFDVDDIMSERRLMEALRVTQEAEAALSEAAAKGGGAAGAGAAKGRRGASSCGSGPRKPPPLWIWAVDLDKEARSELRRLWDVCASTDGGGGLSAAQLRPSEDLHVTLLYLGGGSDVEVASRNPKLGGPDAAARLREDLANREGVAVRAEVGEVIWDGRVAAATVSGLDDICGNLHPHVTLAVGEGVAPRVSNELLARRAADTDLRTGLGPWLSQLGLAQYEDAALEWCLAMGAATTEEIAENAEDLAAAVENQDVEQRKHVAEVFARSALGELSSHVLEVPIRLSGRVHGRRRGE